MKRHRIETDFLVAGTGVAGLFAAMHLQKFGRVLLVTKDILTEGNSNYAQGGVAAAWEDDDDPSQHAEDTWNSGCGLNNIAATDVLVQEGPERIRDLMGIGTDFDHDGPRILLTREGGHSRSRVLHAKGDATGHEMIRALEARIRTCPMISMLENCLSVDLLSSSGRVCGLLALDLTTQSPLFISARSVLLATGGASALYTQTTNPAGATGDGMIMAWAAGAVLRDMEFIQFHPTALYISGQPRFLISEALRGEGAILRNHRGVAFMQGQHPMADLAPRDIVARAIVRECQNEGEDQVFLDARSMTQTAFAKRFPTIFRHLTACGLNPAVDLIPVTPAAHYVMGGIETDLHGRSTLPGLYAAGEVACTGVHGANRLASNSLLECLVFGQRAAEAMVNDGFPRKHLLEDKSPDPSWDFSLPMAVESSQQEAKEALGIIRHGDRLKQTQEHFFQHLGARRGQPSDAISPPNLRRRNLQALVGIIGQFALHRTESRGAHFREDFPNSKDVWKVHQRLSGTTLTRTSPPSFTAVP